jgi:hypothetical protein
MSENEEPSLFIVKMERLKIKLEGKKYKIGDSTFLMDLLDMLPRSNDSKNMNPYEIERRMIETKIEAGPKSMDLEKLDAALAKVYRDHYKGKKIDVEGEKGFFAGKAFKGKCYNCGKLGQKGSDCRNNPKNQDQKGGRYSKPSGRGSGSFSGKCHHCGKKGHMKANCCAMILDRE